jgi:hypothetical protein
VVGNTRSFGVESAAVPVEPARAAPGGAGRGLGEVLRSLDSEVLQVVRPPGDENVAITDVVILDRTDEHCIHPGVVVLAVGLTGTEGEARALVDAAGRGGAAAIAFRAEPDLPERLVEIADELDIALLTVPLEMSWGQLYSLMRTASMSTGVDPTDAAGIPVGDLFALADAIAAAVGGPVTIEDPHWRLLAYSNLDYQIDEARRQTILGRTPPSVWQERLNEQGVAQALRRGDDVVRFDGRLYDDVLASRLAAPVRAGGELLGSIWVAEAGTPLGPAAEAELRRAADSAAVHLVVHRASEDVKRRARGMFMREALEGRVRSSSALALMPPSQGPLTVLLFECADPEAGVGSLPERVLSVIGLYCNDVNTDAVCAVVDDRYWALLPTPRDDARARTTTLARKIIARVEQSLDVRLLAGIGSSVEGLTDVPRSRRSAEQAVKVLRERGGAEPVVHVDDVHAHAVLSELLDLAAEHPGFRQSGLAELLELDDERAAKHAETLRAYLDSWGDMAAAARRLEVHPNTLRYRIRRILETTGLELEDPDQRLVAELQLRLYDARRTPG